MFGFDEGRDARDQVYNQDDNVDPDNKPKFSHELIGAAAGFEGMRKFEEHQRAEGETVDHGTAKELLAGFAGAEVDRLAETDGRDYIDREEAKRHATDRANDLYDQQYGNDANYDPNARDAPQY